MTNTENNDRAYAIGKDAYLNGDNLDTMLDWAVSEGAISDTLSADRAARQGYEATAWRAA